MFRFFLLLLFLMTASPENSKLTLTITNVGSKGGIVQVLIFDQAEGFPDTPSNAYKILKLPIHQGRAVSTVALPKGKYAISAFHDQDGDGKLRTGAFGVPKDPYGFSNNAKGFFGPPAFEKAAFEIRTNEKALEIKLSL